jgi:hypothetical protein
MVVTMGSCESREAESEYTWTRHCDVSLVKKRARKGREKLDGSHKHL